MRKEWHGKRYIVIIDSTIDMKYAIFLCDSMILGCDGFQTSPKWCVGLNPLPSPFTSAFKKIFKVARSLSLSHQRYTPSLCVEQSTNTCTSTDRCRGDRKSNPPMACRLALSEIKLRDFHSSSVKPQYRVSFTSGYSVSTDVKCFSYSRLSVSIKIHCFFAALKLRP